MNCLVFQYLELRFSKAVRICGTVTFIFQMVSLSLINLCSIFKTTTVGQSAVDNEPIKDIKKKKITTDTAHSVLHCIRFF